MLLPISCRPFIVNGTKANSRIAHAVIKGWWEKQGNMTDTLELCIYHQRQNFSEDWQTEIAMKGFFNVFGVADDSK